MDTSKLKKFAQYARRALREIVENKLRFVLAPESTARREQPKAVTELEQQIKKHGEDQVIEKVSYTWFNRFCALRFMDVNRYNRVGVLSPLQGQFQPEILAEAKMGVMDEGMIPSATQKKISDLLGGHAPSQDPQNEAYRLIIVAICNHWHKTMPYLFERIADYTELLMPDDLLSGNSILAYTREAMTPHVCKDVEVIGWLYQFYISEKKDEVFADLKKNKKVTPENIPAATQLFTPNWIVRYLVENSLGRLWLLNRPGSGLIDRMDYYIKPEQEETDFLKINSPEEIKICDPACGSGHMLVYAFELLYAIYEEDGYDAPEIPRLILENNLYGIEIDERAGELAAFALCMKAREKYRRFFSKAVQPQICILEKLSFNGTTHEHGWKQIIDDLCVEGIDREDLIHDLKMFGEVDNFGSLLKPELSADEFEKLIPKALQLEEQYLSDVFLNPISNDVTKILKQADYLCSKYHVVIANPPYMGSKGMNGRLSTWLKDNYSDAKSDIFAAFIMRNIELTLTSGKMGFVTPYVWMFLSSYEKLRRFLLANISFTSLIQLEYNAFAPATIPVCTFIVTNDKNSKIKGSFIRLSNFRGAENQGPRTLEAIRNPNCDWFYTASGNEFGKLPGVPIAYWISNKTRKVFQDFVNIGTIANGE
jgi:hypothetical protein